MRYQDYTIPESTVRSAGARNASDWMLVAESSYCWNYFKKLVNPTTDSKYLLVLYKHSYTFDQTVHTNCNSGICGGPFKDFVITRNAKSVIKWCCQFLKIILIY